MPETTDNISGDFLGKEGKPSASEFVTTSEGGTTFDKGAFLNNYLGASVNQLQNALMATTKQLEKTSRKAKEAEQARLDTLTGELKDVSGGFEEKARSLIEEMELKDKQEKYTGILEEMAKVKEAINLGVLTEGQRIAGLSILGRRQNAIQEQGAARLGALQAIAQIYQGDYEMAKNMADTVMSAFTADKTAQINALNTLIDLSDKKIVSLDSDEKDAIKTEMAMLEDRVKELNDNKDKILGLITKYPVSAQLAKISLTDDPAVALQKMSPYIAAETEASNAETKFETAGGRTWMITYNPATGKILNKTDLGSAYKTGGGGGGGGGTAGVIDTGTIMTFEEWLKELEAQNQINYDISNSSVKAKLDEGYNAYVEEQKKINFDTPENAKALQKILSNTDKQSMIARGLSLNSAADIDKYLKEKEEEEQKKEEENVW